MCQIKAGYNFGLLRVNESVQTEMPYSIMRLNNVIIKIKKSQSQLHCYSCHTFQLCSINGIAVLSDLRCNKWSNNTKNKIILQYQWISHLINTFSAKESCPCPVLESYHGATFTCSLLTMAWRYLCFLNVIS